MAPPRKPKPGAISREEAKALREGIASAGEKLETLKAFGIRTGPLETRLREASKALRKKDASRARKTLDEVLVLLSIASEELNRLFKTGLAGVETAGGAPARAPRDTPTLEEIEATVHDAFRTFIHSTGLRRMVEVIALEKVRQVMIQDGTPETWGRASAKRTPKAGQSRRAAGKKKTRKGKRTR